MLKKTILIGLLISLIFNILHDFVFYKIDPCMKTIKSLEVYFDNNIKFYSEKKISTDNTICDIHQNLHIKFVIFDDINLTFSYKNNFYPVINIDITLKDLVQNMFKPPKLS
ncbi:MAG: hypothetical protein DSY66_05965 [Persephonella sp.]|nr:MAG: hypothetical protein DSY53_04250 [Persephonella sp.]RUM59577.1 MAG: hypothetical protein DSY66_05965 [Persephonella sp.]